MNKLIKRSIFFVSMALLLAFAQFKLSADKTYQFRSFRKRMRSPTTKRPKRLGLVHMRLIRRTLLSDSAFGIWLSTMCRGASVNLTERFSLTRRI